MTKAAAALTIGLTLALANPAGALADGEKVTKTVCTTSYGGTTECREEEVPRETIIHDVTETDTGIVENVALVTGLLGVGFVLMLVAQREQKNLLK